MLCNSSTTLRGVNENINNSYKNDLALSFNVMVSLSLKKFFDEWLKKTKAEGERQGGTVATGKYFFLGKIFRSYRN